jgi:CPA2 family monovalent cation:H+ antiporter-2
MFAFFLPLAHKMTPSWGKEWWADALCGLLTVMFISPFLRAMVMKKNHSEEFRALWTESRVNRLPLLFTVLIRIAIAATFLFYIINHLGHFKNAVIITVAVVAVVLMIMSRSLKRRSIKLERVFVNNLRSREIEAQVHGRRRPLFEGRLLDRDIHISEFDVPEESEWAGKTLQQLQSRNRFGVHVSSIMRGRQRINIPRGDTVVFPGDRIQAIGNDEQLAQFGKAMKNETVSDDPDIEKREMKLRKIIVAPNSSFVGKTLQQSGIRDKYGCMLIGLEEGKENLTMISPSHVFEAGDEIWLVGEEENLERIIKRNNETTEQRIN